MGATAKGVMCMSLWAVPQEVLYYRVWSGKPPSLFLTLQSESFHAKPSQNGSRYKHEEVSMQTADNQGIYAILEQLLRATSEPLTCVDLFDRIPGVKRYAGAPMPLLTLQHEK